MKKRAAEASSKGLSPDEYRRVIVRAHRKDRVDDACMMRPQGDESELTAVINGLIS
jgi:hypothetical protein